MYGLFNAGGMSYLGSLSVFALILAIVVTVLTFIFIVPQKRLKKLNKFGKFLHSTVNFKYLIIEKILQALYIFSTVYVVFCGFFMLFITVDGYREDHWLGLEGLALMILGPIVLRLAYEFSIMLILLVKNVIEINSKLKSNDYESQPSVFADKEFNINGYIKNDPQVPVQPVQPVQPQNTQMHFCESCGSKLNDDGTCPNCK